MQVIYSDERLNGYDLKRIQIDTAKTRQLLLAHGMDETQIDSLRIYVQHGPSARQERDLVAQGDGKKAWGLYCEPCDVYLFTNNRPFLMAPSLNDTLLHELRHHMKQGYGAGEATLPHKRRPSEMDASAFAAEYAKQHRLVSVAGEPQMSMEEIVCQILVAELVVGAVLGALVLCRRNRLVRLQWAWNILCWKGGGR